VCSAELFYCDLLPPGGETGESILSEKIVMMRNWMEQDSNQAKPSNIKRKQTVF